MVRVPTTYSWAHLYAGHWVWIQTPGDRLDSLLLRAARVRGAGPAGGNSRAPAERRCVGGTPQGTRGSPLCSQTVRAFLAERKAHHLSADHHLVVSWRLQDTSDKPKHVTRVTWERLAEASVHEVFNSHPGGCWARGIIQSLFLCLSWRQPKNRLVDTGGKERLSS